MPRSIRIQFAGAFYHVMARGTGSGCNCLTNLLVTTAINHLSASCSLTPIPPSKDRNGVVTTITYDLMGRPLSSSVPVAGVAHVSSRTYGVDENVATETDPLGRQISRYYMPSGKPSSIVYPPAADGQPYLAAGFSYDERDWESNQAWYSLGTGDPLRSTTTTYHANGWRESVVASPSANQDILTKFEYDENGQMTKATADAGVGANYLNLATSTGRNARGGDKTMSEPDALNVSYTPDANGNRVKLTNRLTKSWEFVFDNNNRLLQTKIPKAGGGFRTRGQTFNNRGLVATTTEPSGENATLTYNVPARQTTTEIKSSGGAVQSTIVSTTDPNGNLLTVVENGQTITRVYDALNRLTKFTDGAGNMMEYFYDKNSNLTKLRYPDGKEVTYTYNAHNKLITMEDWMGRVTSYAYDAFDRLVTVTRPSPNRTVRTLSYDLLDRLLQIRETTREGRLVFLRRMTYDNAGRMTTSYQFPDKPALAVVAAAFGYNPDNSLATVNGTNVTIDADGNMTATPLPQSSAGFQPTSVAALSWDARNRLLSAINNQLSTTYTYDAENRRVSKVVQPAGLPAQTTTYAHSPGGALSQLLIETMPGGAKRWFVHGATGIEYQVENDGTVYYLHGDQIGSVLAVTNSNAKTVKRWGYTPYGQAVSYTAAGDVTTPAALTGAPEHGYVGQFGVMTDGNGLLNMRARYYSPYLRRFLNEDPIGFGGGMNWYGYVGGNPLLAIDPSGLQEAPLYLMAPGTTKYWDDVGGSPERLKQHTQVSGAMIAASAAIYAAPAAYAAAAMHPGAIMTASAALDETGMVAAGLGIIAIRSATVHHLATIANPVSKAAGGPYTPKFEQLFSQFGVSMKSAANTISLPFHRGPHPELNQQVYRILEQASDSNAFSASLNYVRNQTATPGSLLNRLATGLDATPFYQSENFAIGSALLRTTQVLSSGNSLSGNSSSGKLH